MFVVDNMKTRQQGEDPGNQLEFHFNERKLFMFMSVLLSSTLVTFLITVSRSKNVFYSQLLILKISKITIKVSFFRMKYAL